MKPTSLILFAALLFAGGVPTANAQTELTPKCKTQTEEGDVACWMKVQNKGDCYVWNWAPATEEKLKYWTGQCTGGLATGEGEALWKYKDDSVKGNGELVDGKQHGNWELRWASGHKEEGVFSNGEKTGRWVTQWADGDVAIGPYVNGVEHGKWEIRHADGSIDDVVYDKGEEVSSAPRSNPKFVIDGEILHYNTDLAATEAGQEITSADRDFFGKVLKENLDIEVIHLTSWGGEIEASYEIADLIIDYGLDTHVVDVCYSACTALLLGGEKRTMERGSKVGFHRSWWDAGGIKDYYEENKEHKGWDTVFDFAAWMYEDTQEEIYEGFEFLLERGIAPLFAIKTLREDSDDGWYPRRKELLEANFLTE